MHKRKSITDPAEDDRAEGTSTPVRRASVGNAVIQQEALLEVDGKRVPTGKREYWAYSILCFATLGTGISTDGGALRQALLSLAYPTGIIHWGHRDIPLNSALLDIAGVLVLVQLVVLLILGSYADYGRWRYWLIMIFDIVLVVCLLGLSTLKEAASWETAQVIWMIGSLASGMLGTFYYASLAEVVRNLPKMIASEESVKDGEKSPEAHAGSDMLQRAKLGNLIHIVGSSSVVVASSIAIAISEILGTGRSQLIWTYRVLLVYFALLTLASSLPYFIYSKRRPGAKWPKGAKWYTLGPKQVYRGAKHLRYLKQCFLYLLGYFCLSFANGTFGSIIGIIQNELIDYSPGTLNAFALTTHLSAGAGYAACLFAQKKWRFSIKQGAFFGSMMAIMPCIWGAIGAHTKVIGWHNTWEIWMIQFWNFATASWGSYNVTMITEVAPAPKMFAIFALFHTVGKASGFIGPLFASVVIERAGGNTNACFWPLSLIGIIGVVVIGYVDTDQAKVDNAEFLRREAMDNETAQDIPTEVTPLLEETI